MHKIIVRVAQEHDFDSIAKHLIVAGELSGDCFSCRHIGIDYTKEKYCPNCKTDFRYISYRKSEGLVSGAQVSRLAQRRPDLTYIEYADIKDISDKLKARNIFK